MRPTVWAGSLGVRGSGVVNQRAGGPPTLCPDHSEELGHYRDRAGANLAGCAPGSRVGGGGQRNPLSAHSELVLLGRSMHLPSLHGLRAPSPPPRCVGNAWLAAPAPSLPGAPEENVRELSLAAQAEPSQPLSPLSLGEAGQSWLLPPPACSLRDGACSPRICVSAGGHTRMAGCSMKNKGKEGGRKEKQGEMLTDKGSDEIK